MTAPCTPGVQPQRSRGGPAESSCLRVQLQVGGRHHLRLNMCGRPIANKYREGKMKRTLKRECKGLEIAGREAEAASRPARRPRRPGCQHELPFPTAQVPGAKAQRPAA